MCSNSLGPGDPTSLPGESGAVDLTQPIPSGVSVPGFRRALRPLAVRWPDGPAGQALITLCILALWSLLSSRPSPADGIPPAAGAPPPAARVQSRPEAPSLTTTGYVAAPMGGALVDVARQPPAAGGMLVETAGQTEAPIVRVANHGRRPATLLLRDGDGHSYGLLVQPGRSGEIGVPPGHYTADITPEDNGAPVTSGDAVFRRFRDYEVVLVDYPRGTSVDGFRLGDR